MPTEFPLDKIVSGRVFPVIYDEATQKKVLEEVRDLFLPLWEVAERAIVISKKDEVEKRVRGMFSNQLQNISYLLGPEFKNASFASEQEWRWIVAFGQGQTHFRAPHIRAQGSGIVSYITMPFKVSEVLCGPKSDSQATMRIFGAATLRSQILHGGAGRFAKFKLSDIPLK